MKFFWRESLEADGQSNVVAEPNRIFGNLPKEIEMDRKLFSEKLAHYALREPKRFLQLDGHYVPGGFDDVIPVDEDGDAVTAQGTVELMHGATVRILIPHGTSPSVAARQLKKLTKWLKRNPQMMDYANPKVAPDDNGISFPKSEGRPTRW